MSAAPPNLYRARSLQINWREVEEEIVVLDLRHRRYLSLNESGVPLWKLLVEGATKAALAEALVAEYEVDYEVARRDVEAFLGMLRKRDLLA